MESILTSIKKLLGITEEYTHFDVDIIMHINSVFMVLRQLGVGPASGFRIIDESATWDDFIPNTILMESVKSYVYLKVSLLFDTNQPSSVIEARSRMIAELEWRLNVAAESDQTN